MKATKTAAAQVDEAASRKTKTQPSRGSKSTAGRNSNVDLHVLYTRWATQHLMALTRHFMELQEFSNINLLDAAISVEDQYRKLIAENIAYRDAHEILRGLDLGLYISGYEPDELSEETDSEDEQG